MTAESPMPNIQGKNSGELAENSRFGRAGVVDDKPQVCHIATGEET